MLTSAIRTLAPIFAVVLPMLMGLGLVYFYLAEIIGMATVFVGAFTLAAVVVAGVLVQATDHHEFHVDPGGLRDE
jgi:hypothetical protein